MTSSVPGPIPIESRRQQRYSRAEQALASSLKHCKPEPTPQELQIRALEQVTTLLGAHAKDAQERASKLREFLADRETDPQLYIAMQKERWMEEKRLSVMDSEAKAIREQLVSLGRFGSSRKRAGNEPKSALTDDERKRRTNLVKFFESSPTRKSISSRKPLSTLYERSPRRVTMNDAPPMLLRSSIASTFTPYAQGHLRSLSLDSKPDNCPSTSSISPHSLRQTFRYPNNAPLATVAEDTAVDQSASVPSTDSKPPSIADSQPSLTSSRCSTPAPSTTDVVPVQSQTLTATPFEDGFATIYVPAVLRSKADILADMVEIKLPAYALDLMEDFDDMHDRIPFQSSALNPTSATPATLPPSGRSSIHVPTPHEPTTPSRHRSLRSFRGLSSPRSFLRRSSSPPPPPPSPSKKSLHRPLSNLFSISESSTAKPSSSSSSARSLPNPRSQHGNNTSIPLSFDNINSSLPQNSASGLRRHFAFLGRN